MAGGARPADQLHAARGGGGRAARAAALAVAPARAAPARYLLHGAPHALTYSQLTSIV